MNNLKCILAIAFVTISTLTLQSGCNAASRNAAEPIAYPDARKGDVVEDLHGQKIADPYRWMEDLDSPELKQWIEAQNEITFDYLEGVPAREKIKKRLTKLWNYEKFGTPRKRGDRYFYSKNDGLQNQYVLYVADELDGHARVLLNPNELSKDGTVALSGIYITDDGKLMAYSLAEAGSDWVQFRVRDVDTGEDLPDQLKWIKFSGASWTNDNQGFFYSRFDEPSEDKLESVNYYQKLMYHKLGTPQSQDVLVYDRPDQKEWGFYSGVTDDGRYLVISIVIGTERKNRIYYKDLQDENAQVVPLLDDFDAQYSLVDNDGPVFWFQTDLDAPRGRVIAVDIRNPQRENWKTIIPEADETLDGINVVNDMFVAQYLKDARGQVKMFNLDGEFVREVELPGIGSVHGFGGKRTDSETFYVFTSFAYPTTIFRYDMNTGVSTVYKRSGADVDPEKYVAKQVFYESKDGTRIPMFIAHRKDLKLDGQNPVYLYGYGGFNVSMTPYFSISNAVWMDMGGVYAMACIRGGGEYGKAWHDGGRLKKKQNCFDDFIAAGEWLIANDYTCTDRLAIGGGSNGGTLVGACITQRPDLFGAALPAVGVMDMLRFHKFTIGWAWTSDFGDPEDPEMFEYILSYSPLHNVKPGAKYPAVMATTADHDDRVVPSHSFKFIAAMQAAQAGLDPILIRVETRAGHGAGKPTDKIIAEITDEWAFLVRALDFKPKGL